MRLFDIYKNKETGEVIEIIGFATPMAEFPSKTLDVVFEYIYESHIGIRRDPHRMGYGEEHKIEEVFEFAMSHNDAARIGDWKDIMTKIKGDVE